MGARCERRDSAKRGLGRGGVHCLRTFVVSARGLSCLWSPRRAHTARWHARSASYLGYIELWEFAFEFSDVVVGLVACDPYFPRGSAPEGVQVERARRGWGAARGRRSEVSKVAVSVEGYVWEGVCCAFEVDVCVVDELSHKEMRCWG